MEIIFKLQFCDILNKFQFIFGQGWNKCEIPNEIQLKNELFTTIFTSFLLKNSQKWIEQLKCDICNKDFDFTKFTFEQLSHFKMSSEFSVIIS